MDMDFLDMMDIKKDSLILFNLLKLDFVTMNGSGVHCTKWKGCDFMLKYDITVLLCMCM